MTSSSSTDIVLECTTVELNNVKMYLIPGSSTLIIQIAATIDEHGLSHAFYTNPPAYTFCINFASCESPFSVIIISLCHVGRSRQGETANERTSQS